MPILTHIISLDLKKLSATNNNNNNFQKERRNHFFSLSFLMKSLPLLQKKILFSSLVDLSPRSAEQRGPLGQLERKLPSTSAPAIAILSAALSLVPAPVTASAASPAATAAPTAAAAAAAATSVAVVVVGRAGGGWDVAVLGWRGDAPLAGLIEDEHGRASLEARVATLAGPVAVARLAQGDVAVCVVLAQG